MKEQAYNIIKTKDLRTERQSNLKKFKEARFKILPQEFEDHTLGEIVSLKIYQYFWLTTLVTAPQTTLKSHTKYLWNIPNFHGAFNESSLEFQRKILERSGLGKETYLPAALHAIPAVPSMATARQEAEEVMFGSLDNLFKATKINLKDIGILVVNCSLFNPTPSLSSMIVNKYNLL
ncbi:3-ketoacyl-CoA synthase 4-like protein [Tanacetum coccineum]